LADKPSSWQEDGQESLDSAENREKRGYGAESGGESLNFPEKRGEPADLAESGQEQVQDGSGGGQGAESGAVLLPEVCPEVEGGEPQGEKGKFDPNAGNPFVGLDVSEADLRHLSPRQREVYVMRYSRVPPMSYADVARKIHTTAPNVAKLVKKAEAALFGKQADSLKKGREAMHQYLVKARKKAPTEKIGEMGDGEFLDAIREKLGMLLASIDVEAISDAKLRDRVYAFDTLWKNMLVAEGRPTQIIRTEEDVRSLEKLAHMLHDELERRGLFAIDVTPETVDVGVEIEAIGDSEGAEGP
jgi:hypothetical protein